MWGSQNPLLGKDTGAISLAGLREAPSSAWDLLHWSSPRSGWGARGDGDGMNRPNLRKVILNLVHHCVQGQDLGGKNGPLPFTPGPAPP